MVRVLWILCIISILTSCSYFTNMNSHENDDQIGRCNELKRQIIFNQATNDPLVAAQQSAEIETLNRAYRENDCK